MELLINGGANLRRRTEMVLGYLVPIISMTVCGGLWPVSGYVKLSGHFLRDEFFSKVIVISHPAVNPSNSSLVLLFRLDAVNSLYEQVLAQKYPSRKIFDKINVFYPTKIFLLLCRVHGLGWWWCCTLIPNSTLTAFLGS